MSRVIDDGIAAAQHEAQRLLGRCLLRLQQYEQLIKLIVAHHELSGPAHALTDIRAAKVAGVANKSLGMMVKQLLGSYVVDESKDEEEMLTDGPQDVISIGLRMNLVLSAEDYGRTRNDLQDLVSLRNQLVHHFIEQHDLWTPEGCRSACDELTAAYRRIDGCFEQLRSWAEHMEQARRLAAEFTQSDAFREFVINGIAPDGVIHWSVSGIVLALSAAGKELAIDGWTSVTAASTWIEARHPEQTPEKYGCSSWRQVIHESRQFELRYKDINGQRAAWFRKR
jgi:hypothetical protein